MVLRASWYMILHSNQSSNQSYNDYSTIFWLLPCNISGRGHHAGIVATYIILLIYHMARYTIVYHVSMGLGQKSAAKNHYTIELPGTTTRDLKLFQGHY